ncbi:MAG TPA: hypothetical protein VIF62_31050 [Labilithrix sp.]
MSHASHASALLFVLAAVATPGCAAHSDAGGEPDGEDVALDENTPAHAAGRFTKAGATIAFDLAAAGDVETIWITTSGGTPLIESKLRSDGSHATVVLGGRLVVEGAANGAQPTFRGDVSAQHDIDAMPEGPCVHALERALATAKVDPSLLPSHRTGSAGGVEPLVTSASYLPCGWSPMSRGQYTLCSTAWLGSTLLVVSNYGSGYDGITTWHNSMPGIGSYVAVGETFYEGWFWGSNYVVQNNGPYQVQLWKPTVQ